MKGFPYGQANALQDKLPVGVQPKLLMSLFDQVEQTE